MKSTLVSLSLAAILSNAAYASDTLAPISVYSVDPSASVEWSKSTQNGFVKEINDVTAQETKNQFAISAVATSNGPLTSNAPSTQEIAKIVSDTFGVAVEVSSEAAPASPSFNTSDARQLIQAKSISTNRFGIETPGSVNLTTNKVVVSAGYSTDNTFAIRGGTGSYSTENSTSGNAREIEFRKRLSTPVWIAVSHLDEGKGTNIYRNGIVTQLLLVKEMRDGKLVVYAGGGLYFNNQHKICPCRGVLPGNKSTTGIATIGTQIKISKRFGLDVAYHFTKRARILTVGAAVNF
jgi:hypothetical protein